MNLELFELALGSRPAARDASGAAVARPAAAEKNSRREEPANAAAAGKRASANAFILWYTLCLNFNLTV